MKRFAALLDALIYTRSRNGKLKLIATICATRPIRIAAGHWRH